MKRITEQKLRMLIEAAIFVADSPLSIRKLQQLLLAEYKVSTQRIKDALNALTLDYERKGVQLVKVASGYRFQANAELSEDLASLTKERAPKYSRAILETLALIAYKQPITRGEIENVRGVAVSSNIIKTLMERSWVKVVGHKEVPGKPALYATTKEFLDYFSLNSLEELPELMPIPELSLEQPPEEESADQADVAQENLDSSTIKETET